MQICRRVFRIELHLKVKRTSSLYTQQQSTAVTITAFTDNKVIGINGEITDLKQKFQNTFLMK